VPDPAGHADKPLGGILYGVGESDPAELRAFGGLGRERCFHKFVPPVVADTILGGEVEVVCSGVGIVAGEGRPQAAVQVLRVVGVAVVYPDAKPDAQVFES